VAIADFGVWVPAARSGGEFDIDGSLLAGPGAFREIEVDGVAVADSRQGLFEGGGIVNGEAVATGIDGDFGGAGGAGMSTTTGVAAASAGIAAASTGIAAASAGVRRATAAGAAREPTG
jgi:hypothetical protein